MSINLQNVESFFKGSFEDYIIQIEYLDNDLITITIQNLESNDFKHFDVFFGISKYGLYQLKFNFGLIEKDLRNYELINLFNDSTSFKAYIKDDSLMPTLVVTISDMDLRDEDEVLKLFQIHFESIISNDDIHKYLVPLANNTIRPG